MARAAKALFEEERRAIIKAVERSASLTFVDNRVERILEDHRPDWQDMIRDFCREGMMAFARPTFQALRRREKSWSIKAAEAVPSLDPVSDAINDWLQVHGAEKVALSADSVGETTRLKLQGLTQQAIGEGDLPLQLAGAIDDLFLDQIIPNRSVTIARTEQLFATNSGSHVGAKAMGPGMLKEWVTAMDDRVRDDHIDMNGVQIPIDEPFDVAGDQMMYPGDYSMGASAGNVIQCRCNPAYERSEEWLAQYLGET